jgi:hypothetical protein
VVRASSAEPNARCAFSVKDGDRDRGRVRGRVSLSHPGQPIEHTCLRKWVKEKHQWLRKIIKKIIKD